MIKFFSFRLRTGAYIVFLSLDPRFRGDDGGGREDDLEVFIALIRRMLHLQHLSLHLLLLRGFGRRCDLVERKWWK